MIIFIIRVSTVSLDNDVQTMSSSTLVAGGKHNRYVAKWPCDVIYYYILQREYVLMYNLL